MVGKNRLRSLYKHILPPIEPRESAPVFTAFFSFLMLMAAYFAVLPLRDEAGLSLGTKSLPFLFMASLIATLVATPVSSHLFSRRNLSKELAHLILHRFFSVSFVAFFVMYVLVPPHPTKPELVSFPYVATRSSFFIWVSLINLFTVSAMWARLADIMTSQAGSRLFGFIGAGATLGQLLGSMLASRLTHIGPGLLFIAAALLELSGQLAFRISPIPTDDLPPEDLSPVSSGTPSKAVSRPDILENESWFRYWSKSMDGFRLIMLSGYLTRICLFLLLNAALSSFFYFERASVVSKSSADAAIRRRMLADINALSAMATVVVQLTLTGRILSAVGVSVGLCASPLASTLGMAAISAQPTATVVAISEASRKVLGYSVTRPSREMLFTVISREEKYKAKFAIDTLIQRLGDAMAAGTVHMLQEWLQLDVRGVAFFAIPVSIFWMVIGYNLGREQQRLAPPRQKPIEESSNEKNSLILVSNA